MKMWGIESKGTIISSIYLDCLVLPELHIRKHSIALDKSLDTVISAASSEQVPSNMQEDLQIQIMLRKL